MSTDLSVSCNDNDNDNSQSCCRNPRPASQSFVAVFSEVQSMFCFNQSFVAKCRRSFQLFLMPSIIQQGAFQLELVDFFWGTTINKDFRLLTMKTLLLLNIFLIFSSSCLAERVRVNIYHLFMVIQNDHYVIVYMNWRLQLIFVGSRHNEV